MTKSKKWYQGIYQQVINRVISMKDNSPDLKKEYGSNLNSERDSWLKWVVF